MSSFFEKLKKGMGIEGAAEESREEAGVEEKPKKQRRRRKAAEVVEDPVPLKELKIEAKSQEPAKEPETLSPVVEDSARLEIIQKEKPVKKEKGKPWQEFDEPTGQLGVDVYQTDSHLVVQSAIAGVRAENLEISMERDVVTIKGSREKPGFEEEGDYFTQECYWGPFARQIIMPVEVDPDSAEASMKEGILTIRIPKILREKKRTIKVKI